MSPPSGEALKPLRLAYESMAEAEKAKIMRFTARHRFTDDLFETWLRESGLQTGELRREMIAERELPSVREKLDAALLRESNEPLLRDTITKYLTKGDNQLLRDIIAWVEQTKATGLEPVSLCIRQTLGTEAAPDDLGTHPQFALVAAALQSGLLDETVEQLAHEVRALALPQSNGSDEVQVTIAARESDPATHSLDSESLAPSSPRIPEECPEASMNERVDQLQKLADEIEAGVQKLRLAKFHSNPAHLTSRIHEAAGLARQIADYVAPLGEWTSVEELAALASIPPYSHQDWAEDLVELLQSMACTHPLRRKREAGEALRSGAIDELLNFKALGGILETVPGPHGSASEWWRWATALQDSAFEKLEDWCSTNSLDQLADLIAEQWSSPAAFRLDLPVESEPAPLASAVAEASNQPEPSAQVEADVSTQIAAAAEFQGAPPLGETSTPSIEPSSSVVSTDSNASNGSNEDSAKTSPAENRSGDFLGHFM